MGTYESIRSLRFLSLVVGSFGDVLCRESSVLRRSTADKVDLA